MKVYTVTAPTQEPLSLMEARAHLRVDHFDEDGVIAGAILAARQHIERTCGLALCTQTMVGVLDEFPARDEVIRFPVHPVQALNSVRFYNDAGGLVTWAGGEYEFDLIGMEARIAPKFNSAWPTPAQRLGAVQVEFIAGFGGPETVPQPILQAMRLLVGVYYENREAVITGTIVAQLPFAVDALLNPWRSMA